MEYGTETSNLQARISRLESQWKAFRIVFVVVSVAVVSQIWLQTRPKAIQTAAIVQARQFEVVDEAGKTVAELSQGRGGPHLVLYDAAYQPVAEFSVAGSDPSIVFYDGGKKQRAVLGMLAGAPTLAVQDAKGVVRVLLTAHDDDSLFWVKDKNGSATILGNAINETRKIGKVDGKDRPYDAVETVSGASIRIQDAQRKVLWKAP